MKQRNEQAAATGRSPAVGAVFMAGVLVVLILLLSTRDAMAAEAGTLSVQTVSMIQSGLSASAVAVPQGGAKRSVLIPSKSVPRSPCKPPSWSPGPPPWVPGPPSWVPGPPPWAPGPPLLSSSQPPWAGMKAKAVGKETKARK